MSNKLEFLLEQEKKAKEAKRYVSNSASCINKIKNPDLMVDKLKELKIKQYESAFGIKNHIE